MPYGDSQIYVELGYNGSGEVKTITAFWEDARGELVSVDRRADEIEVRVNGSKKTFEISTVQSLCISFLRRRMRMIIRETSDMMRICMDCRTFWMPARMQGNDCTVALTKDSKGKIVRICAIAG